MIYYSTGKSPHLAIKGKPVDCLEQTGEHLVQRGFLVRNKIELETQETVEEKSLNINTNTRFNDGSFIEKKKVVKSKGRPKKK